MQQKVIIVKRDPDSFARFKHNMEVHKRSGSPDEYLKPPKIECEKMDINDFKDNPKVIQSLAECFHEHETELK